MLRGKGMIARTKDKKSIVKIDETICKQIYEIMQVHKGKDNAITAKKISSMLNFPMEDTQSLCRTYIAKVMDIFEIPIIGCAKGYFIASTKEEVDEYTDTMQSRISGIQNTIDKVQTYFDS